MAQERIIQNPVPSFRVSYGTWPGPEPILGDIHVDLGNGNSPHQREKFNDLAAQHGGTVRNVGDKLWADFYHESEAQKFVRDAKVSLQMAQQNKEFELSPIMRQYADFKKTMPNLVPLFHVSGGYETYQGDAERVSKVLNIPVQESQTHLGLDDYEGWARGIAAGGYATAPKYAETVIGVIKASNLQKYDQMVIEQMNQEGRNVVTKADVGVAQDPKRAATGFSLPSGQYSMPVQRSEYMLITSAYGERKDPMDRSKTQFHRGIDIQTRSDAVLATEDNGRIVMVNQNVNTGGGKSITVEYSREDGTKTYAEYMHLSKIDVKVGDTVNAGQQLGVSGNTGTRTTGEHLHFGIYVSDANGKRNYVDPAAYLAEIRDKGNLQVEARLSNGKELLAQYQPSERLDAGQPEETDKEQKQDKGEQKEMNPVQWFAKLFGSPDSALGYGGGGIIDSLVSMLMSLLLLTFALDNKKSNEEKMQSVTDALIQKKVDLSALTPNLKSSELSVKENGTSVLTTNDGKNEYSHTLTKAETDNILSIVKSDADAETKAQRLGTMISAVTYSQAASQSYEQMMEQQRSQEQSLQRK